MEKIKESDRLVFKDWLQNRDINTHWTTVAQARRFSESVLKNDFFTISILCYVEKEKEILKNAEWAAQVEFGNPEIWIDKTGWHGEKGELIYSKHNLIEKDRVKYTPFIIHRHWYHKSLNSKFQLIEDFILFYNLYPANNSLLRALSETGEEHDVVRISEEEGNKRIEINTRFLRNYLAIKQKVLVRQHQHFRKLSKNDVKKDYKKGNFQTDNYNFDYWVSSGEMSKNEITSQLFGKDIVLPFDKGKSLLEWEDKYCNFKIGRNNKGEEIEDTCNKDELSNYYVDRGRAFTLTPVFFKREVLKKYYDNPTKYNVDSLLVSCGGLWSLRIDITDNGLVQAYLGDLGSIPYNEQEYWKQYNVVTDEKITKSRFRRDFLAEWVDTEEPMHQFLRAFNSFQENFKKKFDFEPFLSLKHEDEYIYGSIRIPLNNEHPEFDQQINHLAKLLPDSINIKNINKFLSKQKVKEKVLEKEKKIEALRMFLQKNSMPTVIADILKLLQGIRSSCTAHRRGSNCIDILTKNGLETKSNIEIFTQIIKDLTDSLKNINLK